jgi:hypothetical protein
MFNLGAHSSLQALNLVVYRIQTIGQVQLSTLARSQRDMPAYRVRLTALFNTLIAGVSVLLSFPTTRVPPLSLS